MGGGREGRGGEEEGEGEEREERRRRGRGEGEGGGEEKRDEGRRRKEEREKRGRGEGRGGRDLSSSLLFNTHARVNDEVVEYRDLAALPRDKSILQVERPDLMTYQPHFTYSALDAVRTPCRERSLSPPSISPPPSPEIEWRKRKEEDEDGKDEFENLTDDSKTLQELELHKIKSNLGRLILKEEKEKALLGIGRRKTQSLPDRTHMHTSFSLKSSSRSGLARMQSAEFTTEGEQGKTERRGTAGKDGQRKLTAKYAGTE
ncbi:unnamed protein product, partial [Coregonus sp. 'balchen']